MAGYIRRPSAHPRACPTFKHPGSVPAGRPRAATRRVRPAASRCHAIPCTLAGLSARVRRRLPHGRGKTWEGERWGVPSAAYPLPSPFTPAHHGGRRSGVGSITTASTHTGGRLRTESARFQDRRIRPLCHPSSSSIVASPGDDLGSFAQPSVRRGPAGASSAACWRAASTAARESAGTSRSTHRSPARSCRASVRAAPAR